MVRESRRARAIDRRPRTVGYHAMAIKCVSAKLSRAQSTVAGVTGDRARRHAAMACACVFVTNRGQDLAASTATVLRSIFAVRNRVLLMVVGVIGAAAPSSARMSIFRAMVVKVRFCRASRYGAAQCPSRYMAAVHAQVYASVHATSHPARDIAETGVGQLGARAPKPVDRV